MSMSTKLSVYPRESLERARSGRREFGGAHGERELSRCRFARARGMQDGGFIDASQVQL